MMNRQLRLAKRPVGMVDETTFDLVESVVTELLDGEALARVIYLSIDPVARVWLRDEPSHMPPVAIGDVMRGSGIGVVLESRNPFYPEGSVVSGFLGWQEYAVLGREAFGRPVPEGIPMASALNILGSSGLTAYFGLLDVGQATEGDTVVVSAAAGSVGSLVGQIAKIHGCRVIGITGTDAKCRWLTDELGFDGCINYKTDDVGARLDELCPEGIDVYFDNVGGDLFAAALPRLTNDGRLVQCGAIGSYNATESLVGLGAPDAATDRRLRAIRVNEYLERSGEAAEAMLGWITDGRLHPREHIVEGLQQAPRALNMLFTGENRGKLLVQVAPE